MFFCNKKHNESSDSLIFYSDKIQMIQTQSGEDYDTVIAIRSATLVMFGNLTRVSRSSSELQCGAPKATSSRNFCSNDCKLMGGCAPLIERVIICPLCK